MDEISYRSGLPIVTFSRLSTHPYLPWACSPKRSPSLYRTRLSMLARRRLGSRNVVDWVMSEREFCFCLGVMVTDAYRIFAAVRLADDEH